MSNTSIENAPHSPQPAVLPDGAASTPDLRRTPLYTAHQASNARIVDFAGWAMPVLYNGILEEARAVRTRSGLFDISHMGRIRVSGPEATARLQSLTSNDVAALRPSQAQYSLLTNPQGGIIDDIIVYKETDSAYLVVINASNTAKDLDWIRSHNLDGVSLDDMTEETAMIAVQGPDAPQLVASLAGDPGLLALPRFSYATGQIVGAKVTLCRTGYTGEDGFELIVPAVHAADVWTELVAGGSAPCGLGARDALRIEAGYPLYGHEIDDITTPVEAGLMWAVKMDKGEFTGREPISRVREQGAPRRLVGLLSASRNVPRQGYTIYAATDKSSNEVKGVGESSESIGSITSGVFSPMRNHSVAMGYVDAANAKTGISVEIAVRDRRSPAKVVPKKNLLTSAL